MQGSTEARTETSVFAIEGMNNLDRGREKIVQLTCFPYIAFTVIEILQSLSVCIRPVLRVRCKQGMARIQIITNEYSANKRSFFDPTQSL
jgi:hypothetical protein